MPTIKAVPLTRDEAYAYIAALHRHHAPPQGDKFRIGASVDGKLVGVVCVGRPVARGLDDGQTVEVTRLCTDGTPNICSYLYARAARVAQNLGYTHIITYILASEPGTSLRAAGWTHEANVKGRDWSCPSRPRTTTAPSCDKQRWGRILAAKGDTDDERY